MVSVIATTWNEAASLEAFLRTLLAQSLPPDEIIIADGGSTDETPAILRRLAAAHPSLRPIFLPHANRSEGRNAAIAAARGEIIAVTDAGTRAAPDWLERLVAPLQADPAVDMVAGYFDVIANSPLQEAVAAATVVPPERVNGETFLASSRSFAFRKQAWARVGGYPEWLDVSEDSVFAAELRRAGCRGAFAPDAVVSWELSTNLRRLFRQYFLYARGDAHAHQFFGHYYKNYAIPAAAVLWGIGGAWSPLRWVVGGLCALYLAKQCRRAARQRLSAAAVALTPAVVLTIDLAHLLGYGLGFLERPAARRRRAEKRARLADMEPRA